MGWGKGKGEGGVRTETVGVLFLREGFSWTREEWSRGLEKRTKANPRTLQEIRGASPLQTATSRCGSLK